MFFRVKASGDRRYLQIVENTRDGAKTRQTVLATLGRAEELEASGKLDALLRSGARLCETAMVLSGLGGWVPPNGRLTPRGATSTLSADR